MNTKKKIQGILAMILFSAILHAQDSHWSVNINNYQYDMSVYAALVIDDVAVNDYSNYEIAAFVGNECRAVGQPDSKDDKWWIHFRIRSSAVSGEKVDFKLYKKNEKEERTLTAATPVEFKADSLIGMPSSPLTLSSLVQGDANLSGEVNVADITAVVSHIYGNTPEQFSVTAADVNNSGEINVADITGIVNIIYGDTSGSSKVRQRTSDALPVLSVPTVEVIAGDTICVPLFMDNADACSSFQVDVALPKNVTVLDVIQTDMTHTFNSGYVDDNRLDDTPHKFRVMGYSMANEVFPVSADPVVYLVVATAKNAASGTSDVAMASAVTSARGEEVIPELQNGKLIVHTLTDVKKMNEDGGQRVEVTTTSGLRFKVDKSKLNSMQRGIYIINGKKQIVY